MQFSHHGNNKTVLTAPYHGDAKGLIYIYIYIYIYIFNTYTVQIGILLFRKSYREMKFSTGFN